MNHLRIESLECRVLLAASLLKEIQAGTGYSFEVGTDEAVAVGTTVYFTADDGIHGHELWKTDGTTAGTILVKDIQPGIESSYPSSLFNLNGTLFFRANDGVNGYELWKSSGSAGGTVMVKDMEPGPGSSSFNFPISYSGSVIFNGYTSSTGSGMWKSDGTAAGTTFISSAYGMYYGFHLFSGQLYFQYDDGVHGAELWRSNATAAGTVLFQDLWLGEPGTDSGPAAFVNVSGGMYFVATNSASGRELWHTTTTPGTAHMVKDIYPDPGGDSFPDELVAVNNVVYFNAYIPSSGRELWQSSGGTAASTVLVQDLYPGPQGSVVRLVALGSDLLFFGQDPVNGFEPRKLSAGAVSLVKDISPGAASSMGDFKPVNLGGTVYFSANDGSSGVEPWKTDGTSAGTVRIADLYPGPNSSGPFFLPLANGKVLFFAFGETAGYELWVESVDATPPSVSSAALQYQTSPRKAAIIFSEPVNVSTTAADYQIRSVPVATSLPPTSVSHAVDTTQFVIPTGLNQGNYQLIIPAARVSDLAGNSMAAEYVFDFFVLPGDANYDRYVNTEDFNLLAANFNKTSGMTLATGDFNDDGKVNALDFNALASRFGTHLLPPAPSQPTFIALSSAPLQTARLFGDAEIRDEPTLII